MVLLLNTEKSVFRDQRWHDALPFTHSWGFLLSHSSINPKRKINSKLLSNLLLSMNQNIRVFLFLFLFSPNILSQRLFSSIETNCQSAYVFLRMMRYQKEWRVWMNNFKPQTTCDSFKAFFFTVTQRETHSLLSSGALSAPAPVLTA